MFEVASLITIVMIVSDIKVECVPPISKCTKLASLAEASTSCRTVPLLFILNIGHDKAKLLLRCSQFFFHLFFSNSHLIFLISLAFLDVLYLSILTYFGTAT